MLRNWIYPPLLVVTGLWSGRAALAETLAAPPPITYTVEWLGTLPGATSSQTCGMNDNGVVVGTSGERAFRSYVQNGTRVMEDLNAWIADPGVVSDFGTDYVLKEAWGVNKRGQIAGIAWIPSVGNSSDTPFRYTPGYTDTQGTWVPDRLQNLGQYQGARTLGKLINEDGDVAGHWRVATNQGAGFIYSDKDLDGDGTGGDMIPFGAELGVGSLTAYAINNWGEVVGMTFTPGVTNRGGFYYTPGEGCALIRSNDDTRAIGHPLDINDAHIVVGNSFFPPHDGQPYVTGPASRYDCLSGEIETLHADTGSFACAINEFGDIVGTVGQESELFLILGGSEYLMNALIDADLGEISALNRTIRINERGDICGTGTNGAFLLHPIPEPPTVALLLSAAVVGLGWWWRRK